MRASWSESCQVSSRGWVESHEVHCLHGPGGPSQRLHLKVDQRVTCAVQPVRTAHLLPVLHAWHAVAARPSSASRARFRGCALPSSASAAEGGPAVLCILLAVHVECEAGASARLVHARRSCASPTFERGTLMRRAPKAPCRTARNAGKPSLWHDETACGLCIPPSKTAYSTKGSNSQVSLHPEQRSLSGASASTSSPSHPARPPSASTKSSS